MTITVRMRGLYISEDSFIFFTLSSDILLVNIYSYVVKSGYLPPSLPRLSGLVIGCYHMADSVTGYGPSPNSQWQNLYFNGDERKYEQWEVRFLGFLKIKKLKKIACPDDPANPPTDADTVGKNEEVYAHLCQFLDSTSLSLIIRDAKDDGRKSLKILREHYQGSSKPRIISLWTELSKLEKGHDEKATNYLLRAEKAATALTSAGVEVKDSLLVAMCLKGLPDSFESLRTHVIHSDTEYTFQKFKEALKSHEETKKSREPESSDQVLGLEGKTITCYKCHKEGHKANACQAGKSRKKPWCGICRASSHNEKNCRKRNKDNVNTTADGEKHVIFTLNTTVQKTPCNSLFLVDSGASKHVMNDLRYFTSFDTDFDPKGHFVELADGSRTYGVAEKRGTVTINLTDHEGNIIEVKLYGVLYIPSYPQWIFSVRAATENGAVVIFEGNSATIISSGGLKFPVSMKEKLYYLCKSDVSSKQSSTLRNWHQLLGHCNSGDITKLVDCVSGMTLTDRKSFDCESCSVSKMTSKASGPPRETRASHPFELIFTDLAGPLDPVGIHGYRYAIVFTDDYSGCMFTYFLKKKSDASEATERFLSDTSPFGKVKCLSFHDDVFPAGEIQRIRSDNGGEYLSEDFKRLLKKNNIRHELTAPYSPHMNGCAERSWRTLFGTARTLIHESQLPKHLWVYAVSHASYIRNRCYNNRIKDTPYGAVTGQKPDLSDLHVFGSVCYTYIEGHKKKLDDRGRKGLFVGFDKNSPSYLVYYPENNTVLKHRVVKFTDKFEVSEEPALDASLVDVSEDEDVDTTKNNIAEARAEPLAEHNDQAEPRSLPRSNRGVPPERLGIDDTGDHTKSLNMSMDVLYMMQVPTSFQQATESEHGDDWKAAMDEEIDSLTESETYEEAQLPQGSSAIGGKWVYAVKGPSDNPMYKARYVAQGFSQIPGIDFHETFAPTPRMETLRMFIQISAHHGIILHQMDVKSAFLHANLEEEIYIKPPKGYERPGYVLGQSCRKSYPNLLPVTVVTHSL